MRNNNIHTEKLSFKKVNRKLMAVNAGLLVLFFVVQILITSVLGTKTQEIDFIRNEKKELRLENEILTSEIDKSKSLASSEDIKEKYNLVEKNLTFLEGDNFEEVALR